MEAWHEEKALEIDRCICSKVKSEHRQVVCTRDIFVKLIILTGCQFPALDYRRRKMIRDDSMTCINLRDVYMPRLER